VERTQVNALDRTCAAVPIEQEQRDVVPGVRRGRAGGRREDDDLVGGLWWLWLCCGCHGHRGVGQCKLWTLFTQVYTVCS
jgi:hypothetical protein